MLLKQIFTSAIVSLIVLSSNVVVASPLPIPGTDVYNVAAAPPAIPTVEEVMHHLKVDPNESIFYSCDLDNQGTCKQAKAWAKDHEPKYKVLGQLWTDKKYPDPWQVDEATSKKFFDVASEAMARMSAGTVYVVLGPWKQKDGKDWYAQSVWARKEWPELEKNKAVTSVIRVNAATGATIKIKP